MELDACGSRCSRVRARDASRTAFTASWSTGSNRALATTEIDDALAELEARGLVTAHRETTRSRSSRPSTPRPRDRALEEFFPE